MDPRIERTRIAVQRATLDVLGSKGYAAFTVEGVAEHAGIAKSTIYRHWPTKLALIADSLDTLNQQPRPDITATTVRGQITELIDHLVATFADSVFSSCIPALIEAAEHHPEVGNFLHTYSAKRRQTLIDTIQRGIDTGELPEHLDAEMAALSLSGAIIYRRTMTPTPLTSSEGHRLIDTVLGST
jgi:AcrR family transcriptional regulator